MISKRAQPNERAEEKKEEQNVHEWQNTKNSYSKNV